MPAEMGASLIAAAATCGVPVVLGTALAFVMPVRGDAAALVAGFGFGRIVPCRWNADGPK